MMDNLDKSEIGQRIKQLRLISDYTQAEFAELIDISINFLSEIENGKKGLSQDTLAKICSQLNTSADYILFGLKPKQMSFIESANAMSIEELETTIRYLESLIEMKKLCRQTGMQTLRHSCCCIIHAYNRVIPPSRIPTFAS